MTPPSGSGPHLVASDLDGTLLRSDGSLSARTVRTWQALADVGIPSVIVTARPPRWLHGLRELVGSHGVAICANGAFVYDVTRGVILDAQGFTADEARVIARRMQKRFPNAVTSFETNIGAFQAPGYSQLSSAGEELHVNPEIPVDCVRQGTLDDLPDDVVVGKVLLRDPAWQHDEFLPAAIPVVGDLGVIAFSGASGLAEICPNGINKAWRLGWWARQQGIDQSDVWAFGDMPNDIPMIRWAGRGFAVRGGHPDLIEHVDAVCESNDDDGVARALEAAIPQLATSRAEI